MKHDFVVFDVAGTLLSKPLVYEKISAVLLESGKEIPLEEIVYKHKLVSEFFVFPDKTSKDFYQTFNAEFLMALGVIPKVTLLNKLFESCTYLPWVPFEDTKFISGISLPKGILSNWDLSLKEKLDSFFPNMFDNILGSAERGIRKPQIEFYQLLISQLGVAPDRIIYIGDSLRLDIIPATQLGIKAILIDRDNVYPFTGVDRIKSMSELDKYL